MILMKWFFFISAEKIGTTPTSISDVLVIEY